MMFSLTTSLTAMSEVTPDGLELCLLPDPALLYTLNAHDALVSKFRSTRTLLRVKALVNLSPMWLNKMYYFSVLAVSMHVVGWTARCGVISKQEFLD